MGFLGILKVGEGFLGRKGLETPELDPCIVHKQVTYVQATYSNTEDKQR